METPQEQQPSKPNNNIDDEEDEEEEEEYEDENDDEIDEEPNQQTLKSKLRNQRFKVETFSRRLASEQVPIRVHDVFITGNTKTKDWIIEAELDGIEKATTMQELMYASQIAAARLQRLEIFDSCRVKLEAGPEELPNTANVVVDVVETESKLTGGFGVYVKPSVTFLFYLFFCNVCVDLI